MNDDIREQVHHLIVRLSRARAVVHMTAAALNGGTTDLEALAGQALEGTTDSLAEILDDLVGLKNAKDDPQS